MNRPFPAYAGDEPYAFVCYAHADSDVVFDQMQRLNGAGVHLWYDEGIQGGEVWRAELANAIDGATAFLYFISPSSVESAHCQREIHYALDRGIKIVPVYLETTDLPADLRIGLSNVQALFLDDPELHRRLETALDPKSGSPATHASNARSNAMPRRYPAALFAVTALLALAAWWWSSQQSQTDATLNSIAVMPFDDRSPNRGNEWLGQALAETLTENLARIESIRVPGATSTAQLKQAGASVREVGSELNVNSVIEGTVQAIGEDLQISARWVRVDDESILWSGVYPSSMENLLETQRRVSADVAEAIRTTIGIKDGPEFLAAERYTTSDIRAWKALRDAINLVMIPSGGPRADDLRKAAGLAREAIALDPNYAHAHGTLALISERVRKYDQAAAAKRRALELDPFNVSANATFIGYNTSRWDYATAASQLEKAERGISRAGSEIASMFELQRVLWIAGRKDDALTYAARAADLDPPVAWVPYNLGMAYLVLDEPEYANAIAPLEAALRIDDLNLARFFLTIAYANTGRESEAHDSFIRFLAALPSPPAPSQLDSYRATFEARGWQSMLSAVAADIDAQTGSPCPPFGIHALIGDRETVYRCLDEIWSGDPEDWPKRNGWPALFNLLLNPIYAPYRDEPRFAAIVERVRARIDQAAGTGDEFGGIPG